MANFIAVLGTNDEMHKPVANEYIDPAYLHLSTDADQGLTLGTDKGLYAAVGAKGDTGPQGDQGPQGVKGASNNTPPGCQGIGTFQIMNTGRTKYTIGQPYQSNYIVSSCELVNDQTFGSFYVTTIVKYK